MCQFVPWKLCKVGALSEIAHISELLAKQDIACHSQNQTIADSHLLPGLQFGMELAGNIRFSQIRQSVLSAPFLICYHGQLRASSDNSMPRLRSSCTSKINTELLKIRMEFNA